MASDSSAEDSSRQSDKLDTNTIAPVSHPVLPLKKSLLKQICACSLELIVVVFPLLFIILALYANDLHGREVSEWGDKMQQITGYGSTIFPIVFASVLGMAIRSVARWRAEKGTTLRELELLMGSQTLGNTISTQISTLGRSNDFLLGSGLLIFWLLSPIAGQACLRMLSVTQVTTETIGNITYADTWNRTSFAMEDDDLHVRDLYNTLYDHSLISPSYYRTASRDLWGNVKVPLIESFNSSLKDAEDGWIYIDNQDPEHNISYASLIGIPVIGLPMLNLSQERTNKSLTALMTYFTLETNYFVFDCSDIQKVAPEVSMLNYSGYLYNEDSPTPNITFFLDTDTPLERELAEDLPPRSIRFVSNYGVMNVEEDESISLQSAVTDCEVTQSYVELYVECYYEFCEAMAIRKSQLPYGPLEYTPLDYSDHMESVSREFNFRSFDITTLDPTSLWRGTVTEYFLNNPTKVGSLFGYDRDISLLSKEDFTARFGLIFNTFWSATLSPNSLINHNVSEELKEILAYEPSMDISTFFRTITTETKVELTMDRYVRSVWAMMILIVTSGLLLVAAAAGTLLRWRCTGPSVLGYVSTLLVGPGGSALDGPERAKMFADTKVGLVVVGDAGEQQGKVVFSPLPECNTKPEEALLVHK